MTQMNPESWCDEASHVVKDLVDSAHASLQKYHDAMKESYDRSRRPTSVNLINGGDYVYVRNDAESDCLDSRYNGSFIVLNAKTTKRHDRHGRWKDSKRRSESLQN